MKRDYEVTFILRIDPNDEIMNEGIEQVKTWVEADGGSVKKVDRWGRRRLAYEIDKQREGFYVLFESEIDPKNIDELERNLRLAPNVIRHLVVRKDE